MFSVVITYLIMRYHFNVSGLRNDLYRHCPASVSLSILTSVLSDTFNILVTRYTQVLHTPDILITFYISLQGAVVYYRPRIRLGTFFFLCVGE